MKVWQDLDFTNQLNIQNFASVTETWFLENGDFDPHNKQTKNSAQN